MIKNPVLFLLLCSMVSIANAQLPWNNKRAAVVLTYDDGIDINLDTVVPALDSAGLKGTFYVIGGSPVIARRLDEWRKAAASGHELGNHTLFHPCSGGPGRGFITDETDLQKYSVARAAKEIRLTNTLLESIDGKKNRTFAYPCGDLKIGDVFYYKSVAGDFVAARGVNGKMNSSDNMDLEDINSYAIINHSAKYMTDLVDEAIRTKSCVVFLFHGVGGGHSLNVELKAHQALIRYLKAHEKDLWVATMVDVAEYVRSFRTR
jgi:peptidoglycan/xylan/chitin deacetylase (PgdA/CDA1 family)